MFNRHSQELNQKTFYCEVLQIFTGIICNPCSKIINMFRDLKIPDLTVKQNLRLFFVN